MTNTNLPSWVEHIDIINVLLGTLFMVISYFLVRTLRSIDSNQKELYHRIVTLEKDFYTLVGEHNAGARNRRATDPK